MPPFLLLKRFSNDLKPLKDSGFKGGDIQCLMLNHGSSVMYIVVLSLIWDKPESMLWDKPESIHHLGLDHSIN